MVRCRRGSSRLLILLRQAAPRSGAAAQSRTDSRFVVTLESQRRTGFRTRLAFSSRTTRRLPRRADAAAKPRRCPCTERPARTSWSPRIAREGFLIAIEGLSSRFALDWVVARMNNARSREAQVMERSTTVVVVGAGLFWPVCRRVLRAQGVDVVVLEARDRVGGRTLEPSHW